MTSRSTSQQGEFVSLVGPSGCGKTTILNMIAGFIPLSGGEILLNGKAINGPGPERGVVFQSFALFPVEDGARQCRLWAENARRGEGRA